MTPDPIFQRHPDGITLNIPLPEGAWVFLSLLGIGILFTALLGLLRALQSPPKWARRLRLHEKRSLNGLGWFAAVLAPIWFALLLMVLWALFRIVVEFPAVDADQDGTSLRWHVLSLVGLLTALGGLVGTPLALIRVFTSERQTSVAEQSHITDQINKAVENIGATKSVSRQRRTQSGTPLYEKRGNDSADFKKPIFETVTEPNIEVRIGGLLALERISKLNPREHIQIMEILCAYIRENAKAGPLVPTEPPFYSISPRADIAMALNVLARRSPKQIAIEHARFFRLDLRNTDLSGADFGRGDFSAALFVGSNLEAANLSRCRLNGTRFDRSLLNFVQFSDAELKGTVFNHATINRPKLRPGDFSGPLSSGKLHGISLIAADMPSVNHLGDAETILKTFGTKDTVLDETLDENRVGLRKQQSKLHIALRNGRYAEADKIRDELNADGFTHWSAYDHSDSSTVFLYEYFLDEMNLHGFPYRDTS